MGANEAKQRRTNTAPLTFPCTKTGEPRVLKAIIFDVDGTLIDSVDAHAEAWQRAFAEHGVDLAYDAVRSQIGKGGDQLLPVFLPDDEVEGKGKAIDERRAAIVKDEKLDGLQAFPKVRALFERAEGAGLKIALASSAKGEELEVYKRKADIEGLVAEQTSSDDAEKSKPYGDIFQAALDRLPGIEPSQAVVVGDTPYDAEAAAKVGVRAVGVLCGGFSEADLRGAGAVAIFRDPADILARWAAFLEAARG